MLRGVWQSMAGMTRREFVLDAALAGVALGLSRRTAISAPVPSQQSPDPKQGFHRYKIGSAECIAIYDGIQEKALEPPPFKNASVSDTKQALAAAGLRTDIIPMPIAALVVKVNSRIVLCDVGGGGQAPAMDANSLCVSGKLLDNLRAAGIDPGQIETILISHFHPDHILGLMEAKSNRPIFPNAEIIVPGAEYRWWMASSNTGQLPEAYRAAAKRIQTVLPTWKNVLRMHEDDEVVPGIRFVSAPGHTSGHTAFQLASGDAQLLISGDAICVPALGATHPNWQGIYDQDGDKAVETRRRLMDWAITDNMLISGTHFPWPGVGRIAKEGAGYVFII
jgi:glyoxylase-like metal-dependent hydrolase (beta-lactamase superfamily II)